MTAERQPVTLQAPAKLTLSLRVVGVRPDGYHRLEAEMVTVDLADTVVIGPGDRLVVRTDYPDGTGEERRRPGATVPVDGDNLVDRALRALDRRAHVQLVKRVPPGAGLGGGSADAAAVLRWAGCDDLGLAVQLGSDVPFCLTGGRAIVRGVGEQIEMLSYVDQSFVLLIPPFGVETGAVYRAWDAMAADERRTTDGNDLEAAALATDPRLVGWKRVLARASGVAPRLAGSGATWFVPGTLTELGLTAPFLSLGDERARLYEVRTVPRFVR